MTNVSIGIVGAGTIAQTMHLPVLKNVPEAEIAWITDANALRGQSAAAAYGVRFVPLPSSLRELPACDVALLAIPLLSRGAYYELFAERGTAVLAEKPFAICAAEHHRFLSSFTPYSAGCGYMRRMYASNRLLRRLVVDRWFGSLRRICIREGARTTKTGFDQSYQDLSVSDGGGILINLGCHLLDLAFFITGATAYQIQAKNVCFDGATDRRASGSLTLMNLHGREDDTCDFDFCVSWLDKQENTIELDFDAAYVVGYVSPGLEIKVGIRGRSEHAAALKALHEGGVTWNQAFYLEWQEMLRGIKEKTLCDISAVHSLITATLIDDLLGGRNDMNERKSR